MNRLLMPLLLKAEFYLHHRFSATYSVFSCSFLASLLARTYPSEELAGMRGCPVTEMEEHSFWSDSRWQYTQTTKLSCLQE